MVANAPHIHLSAARRVLVAAAVCAAAAIAMMFAASGAWARTQSCSHADAPIVRGDHPELQRAVVCLVNLQRTARHLPPLVANRKLDLSAQRWSVSMVDDQQFTHGPAFFNRISAVGFDWTNAGENIATGYATPESVVRAWMASPGHCANILDPQYREVGTGFIEGAIRGDSSTGGTWTQDFGRLMHQRALSNDFGPAHSCYR